MVHDQSGVTLLELLISIALIGIIMMGLHQVVTTAISSYDHTKRTQDLLAQSRYAMERMVMFVQHTDSVSKPDTATHQEILQVNERVLDMYDNSTHTYCPAGDGILDADNDSDGPINEGDEDPPDLITFDLDKTDGNNWKLREQIPDYSTSGTDDFMPIQVICERVVDFKCSLISTSVVEIALGLSDGENEVCIKTRANIRLIKP